MKNVELMTIEELVKEYTRLACITTWFKFFIRDNIAMLRLDIIKSELEYRYKLDNAIKKYC